MKTNKYIYRTVAAAAVALPLSLFALASCSDEDQSIPTDIKGQVQFTASVSEAPASRADVAYTPIAGQLTVYGNEWASAVKSNYGYNTNTEGWTCTSKEPLYWKDITGTSEYVFYAVAPSEPAPEPAVMKDQSSLENFTASDLLVARSTVAAKETEVPFVLKHVLSQMEINLTTTEGDEKLTAEELATAIVTIDGLKTAYTLAVGTTAEAPVIATVAGDAANGMKPCKDAGVNTFRYITVPQTVTADPGMTLNFTVTVGGKEVKYVYNHKPTFAAGKKNVYHITITKSNLKVNKITVTDWTTGANAEGTALNITVTAQDGTAADIAGISLWNTKDSDKAEYAYDAATGWTAASPYYVEDYEATDLFFARYTPADEAADVTTGIKDVLGNTAGAAIADGGVALTLEHLMSKLTIALTRGESFSEDVDLTGATVTLPGILPTDSITDANVASATGDAETYTLAPATAYLFAPQTIAAGTELTVTLKNGNQYKTALSEAIALAQGTSNKVTIILNPTELAVALSVKDWATGADAASTLAIVTTGTADELTDNSTFSTLNIFVDALTGTPYEYTKTNGAWTSANPLYLDELVAASKLYAQTVNSTADAVTALTDVLGTDATAVKGGVAAFAFRHLLAQMSITLAQGEGFTPSLDGAVITTPDMIKGYTVATDANGNMTAVAGTETQAYTLTDDDAHLVVPQTLAQGSVFTVKLTNGNSYTASLAEAVTLEAGKNTTVTLTLNTTATGVKVAMTDWGTAAAEAAMKLAGLTDGTVTYAANEGDILTVYYNEVNTTAVQGSFKYENNAWTVNTPLYWDEVAQTGYTKKFIAVLTPAEQTTPFADFFVGTATDVTFGSEVSFTLQHAAAQFSFVIKAGTGIDDINTEVPTRTLTLGEGDATGMNADGTINYGTLTNKNYTIGTEALFVTPQTLADSHVVTLARANGNKYTIKLSELMNGTEKLFTNAMVEAGKHYTITLTVNESTVGITAGIAAWTEVSGSGTAKPEF